MKVQIISGESIKPSSETPAHLSTFSLSFFDQFAPPIYVPILLFYANSSDNIECLERRLCRLKISLSDTLTSFYPVAGRIKENFSVECNDAGVDYFEARVDSQLVDVVKKPSVDVLKMFVPFDEPYFVESRSLLAIQVNLFDCGGMVICVCMSHQISDASSVATFIKCWAAKACNSNAVLHPLSGLSSLFPRRDFLGVDGSSWVSRDVVTKRFVFDSSNIASLRSQASNSAHVIDPTRVEAVSVFLWRRFMELFKEKGEHVKACAALHTVNLRGRMDPTILNVERPKNTFGNFSLAVSACQEVEGKRELHVLASKLRDVIKGIDGESVRKMQYGNEYLISLMDDLQRAYTGEMELLKFTSCCRFPWYDADFGWGEPIWVSTTGIPSRNTVVFMDNTTDGIEAWVVMSGEDMAEFEQDEELLSFCILDS